ncbi:MAG TPA: hypothetical protein PLF84_07985 [Bryobacteraceae bacterium]|nr:hypothetical protein [Bryobacterales bacterium]HRJ18967.1 hypothetical protein [Bryobacteraceae bacterium]
MQGEKIARFMELRGHRVLELAGVLFYEAGGGIYMSIPYERTVDLGQDEVNAQLSSHRLTGLRYPSLRLPGLESGLYVRRRPYGLDCLHRNCRIQVREGLKVCEVRQLTGDDLLRDGIVLNRETLQRQQRWDPEFGDPRRWKRFVDALSGSPGVAAFGAFHDDQLEAMAVVCQEGGWLHILHKMSRTPRGGVGGNHVLDYAITQRALSDPATTAVCMGLVSLLDIPGLHTYKSRLGYEVEERNTVVRLHPMLSPLLLNRLSLSAVASLRGRLPGNQRLELIQKVLLAAEKSRIPCRLRTAAGRAEGRTNAR